MAIMIPMVFTLLLSIPALADRSGTAQRDTALKEVRSCLERNGVSSRECTRLHANIQLLIDVYRKGDRSVLPTLFAFDLGEFFGDTLIADPEGFLSALSLLPEKNQRSVATSVAGGMWGLRSRGRFESIRAALRNIPQSQPIRSVAQLCLHEVEQRNSSFFISYFPPDTFSGRASDFNVRRYTSRMYGLGEEPLWPASGTSKSIYRLTFLPSFGNATVISLSVMADGNAKITIRSTKSENALTNERSLAVLENDVARFLSALEQAHFWQTSTELPVPLGKMRTDGAEWILEGVKDGHYRVAVRWSPTFERRDADEIRFGDAGLLLFELAGCSHPGSCNIL